MREAFGNTVSLQKLAVQSLLSRCVTLTNWLLIQRVSLNWRCSFYGIEPVRMLIDNSFSANKLESVQMRNYETSALTYMDAPNRILLAYGCDKC